MPSPYDIIRQSDQRVRAGLDQIDRNSVAKFNAQARAAQFAVSANMQLATLRENQKRTEFQQDLDLRKQAFTEKVQNQTLMLNKMKHKEMSDQRDREWSYQFAETATNIIDSQMKAIGNEEEQLQLQSLAGSLEADARLKELGVQKAGLSKKYNDILERVGERMKMGDVDGLSDELGALEFEPTELGEAETGSVLPDLQSVESSVGFEPVDPKPNTIIGGNSTNPGVDLAAQAVTQQTNAAMVEMVPSVVSRVSDAAQEDFKRSTADIFRPIDGNAPEAVEAMRTANVGSTFATRASGAPTVASLSTEQTAKYMQTIDTSFDAMPSPQHRNALRQGKQVAYSSLLAAGDPGVKKRYQQFHKLLLNKNTSQSRANDMIDEAIDEGMFRPGQKSELLLSKAESEVEEMVDESGSTDLMKSLSDTAKALVVVDNQLNDPDFLGDTSAYSTARNALVGLMNELSGDLDDSVYKNHIQGQIDALRSRGDSDGARILEQEYQTTRAVKSRDIANQYLPRFNQQMESLGVKRPNESFALLAKQGKAAWDDVVLKRMANQAGLDEPTQQMRLISHAEFENYRWAGQHASAEIVDGQALTAPQPPVNHGPQEPKRLDNAVVDNTLFGNIRSAFQGEDEDSNLRDNRRKQFAVELAQAVNVGDDDAGIKSIADAVVSGTPGNPITSAGELMRTRFMPSERLWSDDYINERNFPNPEVASALRRLRDVSTAIADRQTERVWSRNSGPLEEQKDEIDAANLPGRFDLNVREDYHNAYKQMTAKRIWLKLTELRDGILPQ